MALPDIEKTWPAEQLIGWQAGCIGNAQKWEFREQAKQALLQQGVLYINSKGKLDSKPGSSAPWANQ